MKKRSLLVFMLIFTSLFGAVLLAIVYGIFHSVAFPDGRFVGSFSRGASGAVAFLIPLGVIVLGLFCGGYYFVRRTVNILELENTATHQEIVRVVAKTSQLDGSFFTTTYIVAFELPNKVRKAFDIDKTHYSTIVEGETGLLTYKQNSEQLHFVHFQPLN